jgi:hemoglobin
MAEMQSLLLSLACLLSAAATAAPATLYERLGGQESVHAIAAALIDRVAADPEHGQSFKDTNLERIKTLLAEQICELSGGPCKYSGDPMREVHAGHHITQADFYDMVATLRDVLKERHVPLGATNELLRLLAPMKRDIVEIAQPGAK